MNFTNETDELSFDLKIINTVKGYPIIYNRNHKDFKDKNIRKQTWIQIGNSLNRSVKDCQRRWVYLKNRFWREHNFRILEAMTIDDRDPTAGKEFPPYRKSTEHIQSRRTCSNVLQPVNSNITQAVQNRTAVLSSPSTSNVNTIQKALSQQASAQNVPGKSAFVPYQHNNSSTPSQPSFKNSFVISPQSTTTSRSSSDIDENKSLQQNVSIPKRMWEESTKQGHTNTVTKCIAKKRQTKLMQNTLLKMSSKLSSCIREFQMSLGNRSEVMFQGWITSELLQLPEKERREKMKKIAEIVLE